MSPKFKQVAIPAIFLVVMLVLFVPSVFVDLLSPHLVAWFDSLGAAEQGALRTAGSYANVVIGPAVMALAFVLRFIVIARKVRQNDSIDDQGA